MICVSEDRAGKVHLHAAAVAALRNACNDGAYYSRDVIRVHGVAEGGEGERVKEAGTRTRGNTLRYTSAATSPHAAVVHGLRPLPQLGDDRRDGRLVKAGAGEVTRPG